MKKGKLKENDQLAVLLKQELMDIPSAEFSDKLLRTSMNSYSISYSTKYRKEERLGKVIMIILVFFNFMMLYLLKPLGMHPAILLSFLALAVGIGFLLWMNVKAVGVVFTDRKLKTKFPA
ncbi:hypothetical protein LZQ00_02325 [Sphingobacterium sp. SRCM116780]|uniref:hypothetical protein n=1 Tax=Sphingobacterium sp. SRCM116780 TaxID=2907623 RepID=UPI001F46E13C|nr:hypothetical protein [Sphingobacterium sp. SRCM116780]UIR56661.1 hypothetical protein LZQ00_02325 [Sphingobacterium sp. SRCM116780]